MDWFLRTVHQPHYDHFKDDFGKTIIGFFHDEPETHGDWGTEVPKVLAGKGVDWKPAYVAWKFQLAGDTQAAARHAYHEALSEAWGRTLYGGMTRWCRAHGVTSFYAGDAYVDIVGLDAYTDVVDPKHILGYPELARLPKPFGFTEFGPHGPHTPPGDYDYRRFRDGIEANFPRTSFFPCWDGKWGLGRNMQTKALLDHPWIINREDLPREFAAGH